MLELSTRIYAVVLAIAVIAPYILGWSKVDRETPSTIVFCRYVEKFPVGWKIGVSVFIVLTGLAALYSRYGRFDVPMVLLALSYPLAWILLGLTMPEEVYGLHHPSLLCLLTVQSLVLFRLMPPTWLSRPRRLLGFVILFMVLVVSMSVTNAARFSQLVPDQATDTVFSVLSFLVALFIPTMIFLIPVDKPRRLGHDQIVLEREQRIGIYIRFVIPSIAVSTALIFALNQVFPRRRWE